MPGFANSLQAKPQNPRQSCDYPPQKPTATAPRREELSIPGCLASFSALLTGDKTCPSHPSALVLWFATCGSWNRRIKVPASPRGLERGLRG